MPFILTIDMLQPARYFCTSTYPRYKRNVPKVPPPPTRVGPKRVCDTKLLSKKRLKQFLPCLKSEFPEISPVYHLAVNILQHGFQWEGMGMHTTDQSCYEPYVVIYKPTGGSKKQIYMPMFRDCLRVFIWAYSADVLQQTMEKDSKMLDWNMPIVFMGVGVCNLDTLGCTMEVAVQNITAFKTLLNIHCSPLRSLRDVDTSLAWMLCRHEGLPGSFKIIAPESGWRTSEGRFWFDLQKTNFRRLPHPKRPKGLHMGQLSLKHLDHVLKSCDYSSVWWGLFSQMLSSGFPSAALFLGSGSDTPVSYCVYMPHGCISAVYVHPSHVNLFRLVLVELLIRLKEMGYASAWMDTGSLFFPLQMEDIRGLGGKECKGQGTCWVKYTPHSSECPQEEGNLGYRERVFHPVRHVKSVGDVEEDVSVHNDAGFKCYEDRYDSVYKGSIKRTIRRRSYDAGWKIPGRSGRRKSLQGRNEHGFAGLQEDPYEFCEYEDMTVSQRRKR